jgi:hypothetical protein
MIGPAILIFAALQNYTAMHETSLAWVSHCALSIPTVIPNSNSRSSVTYTP